MIVQKTSDYQNLIGFKFSTTVSLTGIIIGCKHYKTYKEFLEKSPVDGRNNGYDDFDMKYLNSVIKNSLIYLKRLKKDK